MTGLSVEVSRPSGNWVNLDEEEDELLVQMAKSRQARRAAQAAEGEVEGVKQQLEGLKLRLRDAHALLKMKEEEAKRARATCTWEEGRLQSQKLKECLSAAGTPKQHAGVQAGVWGRGSEQENRQLVEKYFIVQDEPGSPKRLPWENLSVTGLPAGAGSSGDQGVPKGAVLEEAPVTGLATGVQEVAGEGSAAAGVPAESLGAEAAQGGDGQEGGEEGLEVEEEKGEEMEVEEAAEEVFGPQPEGGGGEVQDGGVESTIAGKNRMGRPRRGSVASAKGARSRRGSVVSEAGAGFQQAPADKKKAKKQAKKKQALVRREAAAVAAVERTGSTASGSAGGSPARAGVQRNIVAALGLKKK